MFPMPRCESCGARGPCEAAGVPRVEYPRCKLPLRDVDLGRTSSLLEWLAASAGVDGSTAAALHGPLLARYSIDRHERPDVLELSFSCDEAGAHVYRFSYGFPTLRRERATIEHAFVDVCRPLGATAVEAARTVLRTARSKAVEQVLFGYAHGGGRSATRAKLYVQFLAGEAALALDLAGRMIGRPLTEMLHAGPLHLLCLDLGSKGVSGAKLYFLLDRLRLDDLPARVGPVPLAAELRQLGVTEVRDVLAIHRLRGPHDPSVARVAEIDFPLEVNDLGWRDVRELPLVRALLDRDARIAELERRFCLAIRRVSGSVGDGTKLNVYYGLNEREGER